MIPESYGFLMVSGEIEVNQIAVGYIMLTLNIIRIFVWRFYI